MKVLEDPDAPHQFGNTPLKTMMPSMVRPPADPEAAKSFTAMTPADQDAVATFLEAQARGERAEGTPGEIVKRRAARAATASTGRRTTRTRWRPSSAGGRRPRRSTRKSPTRRASEAYPAALKKGDQEGLMPAYEDKLSAADRKLLVTWLLSQRSKTAPAK